MTHDFDDDVIDGDAPLDTLLRERLSGDRPPDLTAAVRTRHRRGDGVSVTARLDADAGLARSGGRHRLLAAALVVLGLGAVAGTLWLTRGNTTATARQPVAETPQDPQPTPVVDPRIKIANHQDPDRLADADQSFELRVVDRHGGPIQEFEFSVLKIRQRQPPTYVKLSGFDQLHRQPRDFTSDFTEISGLPADRYVLAIKDAMHALTISEPFRVSSQETTKVTVSLNLGGELTGIVVDPAGIPVAGALVRTVPAEAVALPAESPFRELLVQLQPSLHTLVETRTDAKGRFHLRKLTYGEYRLDVEHADFCRMSSGRLQVSERRTDAGKIELQRGASLHGIVTERGRPRPGTIIKISSMARTDGTRPGPWSTASDEQGAFRFPFRLPPGDYVMSPVVEPDQVGPFAAHSTVPFQIQVGDRQIEKNLEVK